MAAVAEFAVPRSEIQRSRICKSQCSTESDGARRVNLRRDFGYRILVKLAIDTIEMEAKTEIIQGNEN
jgi:hypothetical protein